jgi:hypothetical protein
MARQTKITAAKRARERALTERRQNKQARRTEAKHEQAGRNPGADGAVDPDIAGIVPGPQPRQAWQDEEE